MWAVFVLMDDGLAIEVFAADAKVAIETAAREKLRCCRLSCL